MRRNSYDWQGLHNDAELSRAIPTQPWLYKDYKISAEWNNFFDIFWILFGHRIVWRLVSFLIDRFDSQCIKDLLTAELDKLPNKCSSDSKQNKKVRTGSGFWNEELSNLWNDYCDKEKEYLNFKCYNRVDEQNKKTLREAFKQSQKLFDKRHRYFKRKAWVLLGFSPMIW